MTRTLKLQYQKFHCNWIRENEPEIWEKTDKYVLWGTYLNYKLTGRMADSDASIVGYLPYDFKNRRWKKKNDLVRPVFDLPDRMMCELVRPGECIGKLYTALRFNFARPLYAGNRNFQRLLAHFMV